ncbi:MAG: phospho-N-acetylmuramoyl-pentapeptide-transferase [Chloroflexi bacterium]|nr:phospho-N-acetylmuramoyl-pentapeptide-transferase [Chloroflexota bacterium]
MNNDIPFSLALGGFTFLLVAIWGGPFVEILRRLKIGKNIREGMPDEHYKKKGTPTMGGILILLPVLAIAFGLNLANLLNEGLTGQSIMIPLSVLVGYGLLGAYDDWEGIQTSRGNIGEGISPRFKFGAQLLLAAIVLYLMNSFDIAFSNQVLIPLIPEPIDLPPVLWIVTGVFLIVGMSNAVNLIDGLDGLAGIITASAYIAYGLISALQGQTFITQFCFIMVGACFGFLWYNANPAQLFMGDTGSLALGAALATVAIMTGQWFLLPLIAILPVSAALSVVIQVAYFKWSGGQRIFLKAPIHHHFEELGWSETQVVQRFWLVGILAAMVGVSLALL